MTATLTSKSVDDTAQSP